MQNPPRILVVDDDRAIRTLLRDYLQSNGFETTAVGDGEAMFAHLAAQHTDLVVLDLMLPGENGLDLCRRLRRDSNLPVIMLTALGDEVERIVGLEVGADDYLPKPFNPRELLGRIRAVLRRAAPAPSNTPVVAWSFDAWRLDLAARELHCESGQVEALGDADFQTLALLLNSAPEVVDRVTIQRELRGREHDPFDRSIDVRISRLRQLLGDDARAPRIIKTVYGKGYVIGVPVRPLTAGPSA
jgi:two-component system OmpR family response regulator